MQRTAVNTEPALTRAELIAELATSNPHLRVAIYLLHDYNEWHPFRVHLLRPRSATPEQGGAGSLPLGG